MCHCEEGKARRSNRKTDEKKGITTLAVLARNDRAKAAFTLAEVLITLGIIGVVASVTLPALITNVQSRIRAEQIRSAKYKFTLATDKMNSLGLIGPYDSTEAFVKELQKHLKIAKVCPPGKLEGCWPTKEVKLNAEGDMFEIKKAVTGKQFKMESNDASDYTSNNVGIVTADGIPMIINYNKKCEPLDSVKQYAWTTEDNKPVSNATAGCVAAVMDINGSKKPNKLSEDVVLFNAKGLGTGCGFELNGKCFSSLISSYTPMSKADCDARKNELGIKNCGGDNDYWAGAVAVCGGTSKLPSMSDLADLATIIYGTNIQTIGTNNNLVFNNEAAAKLSLPGPWFYIYSDEQDSSSMYFREFAPNSTRGGSHYRWYSQLSVICLVD